MLCTFSSHCLYTPLFTDQVLLIKLSDWLNYIYVFVLKNTVFFICDLIGGQWIGDKCALFIRLQADCLITVCGFKWMRTLKAKCTYAWVDLTWVRHTRSNVERSGAEALTPEINLSVCLSPTFFHFLMSFPLMIVVQWHIKCSACTSEFGVGREGVSAISASGSECVHEQGKPMSNDCWIIGVCWLEKWPLSQCPCRTKRTLKVPEGFKCKCLTLVCPADTLYPFCHRVFCSEVFRFSAWLRAGLKNEDFFFCGELVNF